MGELQLDGVSIIISITSMLTALGGWKFISYLMNRDMIKKEKTMNIQHTEMEQLRKQVDWMQEKYETVSKKLDELYKKFRDLEEENIKLLKENSELKVALKIAEYNRCERPDDECIRRIPSRQKCRLKMLLNGTYEAEDVFKEDVEDTAVGDSNSERNGTLEIYTRVNKSKQPGQQ